jgi:hypothetical protein
MESPNPFGCSLKETGDIAATLFTFSADHFLISLDSANFLTRFFGLLSAAFGLHGFSASQAVKLIKLELYLFGFAFCSDEGF